LVGLNKVNSAPTLKIFLLLIFWSLWYLSFSTRTVLSPLLPLIEDDFAISHASAGSLFFFLSAGYTTAVLLAGLLPQRIGYKRSIISSFILLIASLCALKYAETYYSFAGVLFFVGLGSGIYLPCAIPLITSVFGRGNWGKAIAFHETAASFSIFTIPLLSVFTLRFFHWRAFFVIMSGVSLMVIILFWGLSPDPRPVKEKGAKVSSILRRRDLWVMAVFWAFAGISSSGIYNVIPLFLVKEKGMLLETANSVFGISRVGGVFVTMLIGFVLDRYGVKKILIIILLTTGLSTVGLAVAEMFWILVVMLAIQATVSVVFFPVAIVGVSKLTTLSERSIFTAIILAITVIVGSGITPVLLGAVADAWNFKIGIFVAGVLTAGTCLLFRYLQEIS
jgi:NNP family nitrate/nitrite transporter-like MFS transporter